MERVLAPIYKMILDASGGAARLCPDIALEAVPDKNPAGSCQGHPRRGFALPSPSIVIVAIVVARAT